MSKLLDVAYMTTAIDIEARQCNRLAVNGTKIIRQYDGTKMMIRWKIYHSKTHIQTYDRQTSQKD